MLLSCHGRRFRGPELYRDAAAPITIWPPAPWRSRLALLSRCPQRRARWPIIINPGYACDDCIFIIIQHTHTSWRTRLPHTACGRASAKCGPISHRGESGRWCRRGEHIFYLRSRASWKRERWRITLTRHTINVWFSDYDIISDMDAYVWRVCVLSHILSRWRPVVVITDTREQGWIRINFF